jgi:hypothetical protein
MSISDLYYQPENLWVGNQAIEKLTKAGFKPRAIRKFLAKQALWQIHIPPPEKIEHPHYEITKPNFQHQFDLLFMPGDKLYGSKYKYILTGIDVASRFKVARPLRTKQAREVAEMIADIYKSTSSLTWPEQVQVDNGTEFKAEVKKLFEKHNVAYNNATTKYKHKHTAFVESYNKVLAARLFKAQDAQELNDPELVATTWVKQLYKIVDQLNNTKTVMIKMKPKEAIKLDNVPLKKKYRKEKLLREDGLYRYLLQPGEENEDQRRRATDNIWSRGTYRISEIIQDPGNRVLYYLADAPKRAFVREELMLIPEDTQVPPDYVKKW